MKAAASPGRMEAAQRLLAAMNGYQQTCVIVAASRLGIFEHLALGPLSEEALAERISADARSLHRLMRALRSLSLVEGDPDVELTAMGRLLVPREPGLADMPILIGEEYLQCWGALFYSVKTGLPSFEKIFGMTAWEHRKLRPELGKAFNRMTSGQRDDGLRALAKAYDFSLHRHIVDVGGGSGYFLKAILAQHPTVRATLFDLPQVVQTPVVIDGRCAVVGGSFIESVPAGGDLYILKHVLHDWSDEACIAIIANIREAIASDGTVLIIESILPEPGSDVGQAREVVMLDLHMMTVLGGRERELSEYERLLRAGGFELTGFVPGAPATLASRPV